jgi:hypothetical protein
VPVEPEIVVTDQVDDRTSSLGGQEGYGRRLDAALRPGGRLALSAFNAYFAVKYQTDADFDAATGVNHERTELRSETGDVLAAELWTGCWTPKELRMLFGQHELDIDSIASVEPGAYGADPPTVESPEFLVLATRSALV